MLAWEKKNRLGFRGLPALLPVGVSQFFCDVIELIPRERKITQVTGDVSLEGKTVEHTMANVGLI
jgi:hypothetical protein